MKFCDIAGITWNPKSKRWVVRCTKDGKRLWVGTTTRLDEAKRMLRKAQKEGVTSKKPQGRVLASGINGVYKHKDSWYTVDNSNKEYHFKNIEDAIKAKEDIEAGKTIIKLTGHIRDLTNKRGYKNRPFNAVYKGKSLGFYSTREEAQEELDKARKEGKVPEPPPRNKLTEKDALEIVSLLKRKIPKRRIAVKYGVHHQTICALSWGITWGHITGIKPKRKAKVSRRA